MLDKVKEIERKYRGIEAELAQPETYADIERCAALNKELTELQPLVDAYRRHEALTGQLRDAEELLRDAELGELAREESEAARAALAACEEEIKKLLEGEDNLVLLAEGLTREEMKAVMEKAIWNKPAWHGDLDALHRSQAGRNMNQIGG